jgi:hypothetical protein
MQISSEAAPMIAVGEEHPSPLSAAESRGFHSDKAFTACRHARREALQITLIYTDIAAIEVRRRSVRVACNDGRKVAL